MNLRSSLIAGAIAGLLAGLLFAALRALIIVPIWSRMIMGLAFGVGAGMAAGWAYAEFRPPDSNVRRGVTFGFLLFLAVLPVTMTDAALRSVGVTQQHRDLADAISVVLAVLGGVVVGWVRTQRVRPAVAMGAAALCLTLAMGGAVPAARSVRAVEIYLAVLVASLFAGTVLGALEPRLQRLSASIFGARNSE